jgi:hypothetical protein
MTVQQLIDKLEQVQNKGLQVIIRGTDFCDWDYYNPIDENSIEEKNVYEEDRKQFRRRLVIDGGEF